MSAQMDGPSLNVHTLQEDRTAHDSDPVWDTKIENSLQANERSDTKGKSDLLIDMRRGLVRDGSVLTAGEPRLKIEDSPHIVRYESLNSDFVQTDIQVDQSEDNIFPIGGGVDFKTTDAF